MIKKIDAIDVTKYVADNLKANDYKNKTEEENINILEDCLYHYSLNKLNDWGIGVNGIRLNTLDTLMDVIDKVTYNYKEEERNAFFNQYIHCILYILGEIRKQDQIELLEIELDNDVAILEDNNSNIKAIAINENTKKYHVPTAIIEAYRNRYLNKEKTLAK